MRGYVDWLVIPEYSTVREEGVMASVVAPKPLHHSLLWGMEASSAPWSLSRGGCMCVFVGVKELSPLFPLLE